MNRTPIEWAKNPDGSQGYTWNPITGCLNGCDYCYARKLANTRLRERYLANENTIMRFSDGFAPVKLKVTDPFYPRFWSERIEEVVRKYRTSRAGYRWRPYKPRGIFTCDMSDLFGIGVPGDWTRQVLNVIDYCTIDRFYLLTKQPQNLIKFSPFPGNCWVGGTVTANGDMTRYLTEMVNIEASLRFISFEPLLGNIGMNDHMSMKGLVDWVIIGAQTKPYKPPKIEWVQEILVACHNADVPVFMKNNLQPLLDDSVGWAGWKLRQEMPILT